jgi:hypothetical protein
MPLIRVGFAFFVSLSVALPQAAFTQSPQAHVHGLAHADVAVDGGAVDITLRATAHDLVGFERKATNPADEARWVAAQKAVLDPARLWRFTVAARCVAEAPVLDVSGGHDHEHGHEHAAHADWQVRYRFRCDAPEALAAIATGVFEVFPSLQTLEVQFIDDGGARQVTLTAAAPRLVLQ